MKWLKKLILPLLFIGLTVGAIKVLYDLNFVANSIELGQKEHRIIIKNEQKQIKNERQAKISSVGLTDLTNAKLQLKNTINEYLIGQLVIPSINLNLPIFSQATDKTLSTGVAQYYPQRLMGQSNYVLASHNFEDAPVLMHAIKQLKNGAKMYVTNGASTYQYQVSTNKVIRETNTAVLEPTTSPQLTLLRCEGGINTPYRRVVTGKMVRVVQDKVVVQQLAKATQNTSDYQKQLQQLAEHKSLLIAAKHLAIILDGRGSGLLIGLLISWLLIAFVLIKLQL